MDLQVEHSFAFEYDAFISESFLELRVQPKATPEQTVASFELAVGPPTSVHRYRDWNDNLTHHFTITKFHDRIAVAARSLVETRVWSVAIGSLTERPADAPSYVLRDFLEFGGPVELTPALRAAHRAIGLAPTAAIGEQVLALGSYIHEHFEYRKNVTAYDSTTEDFLKIGGGVAQETLKAEVVTEVVPGKVVSTLREEITHIDLPVFREIPARPPDRLVTNVADVTTQQQQQ